MLVTHASASFYVLTDFIGFLVVKEFYYFEFQMGEIFLFDFEGHWC